MIKQWARWLKGLCFVLIFVNSGWVAAGSYEDFFHAVKHDDSIKIKELLTRGFDPNTINEKGVTGLFLAAMEPSFKTAHVLMDWPRTNVNQHNAQGESVLMLVCLKGHQELAEKLIQKGADVNKTGWAPLHYAASGGHPGLISLLLENHAYIDAESPNGSTPLMMAAMYGNEASVKLLLQEGADTKLKNQQGLSALDFAQRGKRPDAVDAIARAIRSKQPVGQW
jgi:ankyrin repeat protein